MLPIAVAGYAIMYKNILYATDFSKASLVTEKKVADLCQQHNAALSVIHVVNYGSAVWMGSGGYYVMAELNEETIEEGKKAMSVFEDRMPVTLAGSKTVQGSPKQEIVAYAEEIGADLIVLGSHGHFQIADVLGTTASGVLHKAGCDVLVVQSGDE